MNLHTFTHTMITCFLTLCALLELLLLPVNAQGVLGSSCSQSKCLENLQCVEASSGKVCMRGVRLNEDCGQPFSVCQSGARCVLGTEIGKSACLKIVGAGKLCGVPPDDIRTVGTCGNGLSCDFSAPREESKVCFKTVKPYDVCDVSNLRCPPKHACRMDSRSKLNTCQPAPEVGIGQICAAYNQSRTAPGNIAACKQRSSQSCTYGAGQWTLHRCRKFGELGDLCDKDWLQCAGDLQCRVEKGTNLTKCSIPPLVGLGSPCHAARCGTNIACRSGICTKILQLGEKCDNFGYCAKGLICGAQKSCERSPIVGLGSRCDAALFREFGECDFGLLCDERLINSRCVLPLLKGSKCGNIYSRCPDNHECLDDPIKGGKTCQEVALEGGRCENMTCPCLQMYHESSECPNRMPCYTSAHGKVCIGSTLDRIISTLK